MKISSSEMQSDFSISSQKSKEKQNSNNKIAEKSSLYSIVTSPKNPLISDPYDVVILEEPKQKNIDKKPENINNNSDQNSKDLENSLENRNLQKSCSPEKSRILLNKIPEKIKTISLKKVELSNKKDENLHSDIKIYENIGISTESKNLNENIENSIEKKEHKFETKNFDIININSEKLQIPNNFTNSQNSFKIPINCENSQTDYKIKLNDFIKSHSKLKLTIAEKPITKKSQIDFFRKRFSDRFSRIDQYMAENIKQKFEFHETQIRQAKIRGRSVSEFRGKQMNQFMQNSINSHNNFILNNKFY